MSIRMHLDLPAAPDAASVARHALTGLTSIIGRELTESVQLMVSELVTNSIRHAGMTPGDVVRVRTDVWPETVRVEVEDAGPGFEAVPRIPKIDAYAASGWGLTLVDRLASRWGCQPVGGHTVAWFEIDRANAPRPFPRSPGRQNASANGSGS